MILFYEAGVDDNSWDTANTEEEEETGSVSTETESEQDSTGIKSVLSTQQFLHLLRKVLSRRTRRCLETE